MLICTFVTCRGWENTGLMLGTEKNTFRDWNNILRYYNMNAISKTKTLLTPKIVVNTLKKYFELVERLESYKN